MIRLVARLLSRRPRPQGGAAAPAPKRPAPYSSAWHQSRAHKASEAAHHAYQQRASGHGCKPPGRIASMAEIAADEWAACARALRAEAVDVAVPDTPDDLLGGM